METVTSLLGMMNVQVSKQLLEIELETETDVPVIFQSPERVPHPGEWVANKVRVESTVSVQPFVQSENSLVPPLLITATLIEPESEPEATIVVRA